MAAVSQVKKERIQTRATVSDVHADIAFLALASGLSFVLYVVRLGFYSDDWVFLELLTRSDNQSVWGLYRALAMGDVVIRQRPIQILYLAALYRLFGLHPVGYHLVNVSLMTASTVLFYLSLRELRQPRLLAIALPLVYVMLPHYSTDRFWLAAHQATISLVFYFLSLYADLRTGRDRSTFPIRWKLVSLASMVVSGLAYEVALPLFLLNPLLVWLADRQRPAPGAGRVTRQKQTMMSLASHLTVLALVIAFKAFVTVRLDRTSGIVDHLVGVAVGALRVNFGIYGVGLPYVVWWIVLNAAHWQVLGLSAVLALAIYAYLMRLPDHELPNWRQWLAVAGLGVCVFVLGYAVFVANTDVWFTSASLGNRVSIAAAIGVAMIFVGLLGWASVRALPRTWQRQAICISFAALATTGFLVNNTLAAFWITAYQQQQLILDDLQAPGRALPAQSSLILDAVCLEHGGAYLFTGNRDLASALRLRTGDPTLWATAITNSPDIGPGGLTVYTYGEATIYPYGDRLFVYNYSLRQMHPLPDAQSAVRYFASRAFTPASDCPPGFAWGLNSD